ncbi:MAG: polysulfide reductase [candidate division Zixibacteria bacterium RBG_16_53_22]|nr:MAG: polysulfide reductase [candidate division Zixibacteria bacterium RBG_16_53_22]
MSAHEMAAPIRQPFLTRGTKILLAIAGIGAIAYIYRLLFGLEAATNLDNQYPWGIWISIDVATGVALAAGGFTTAALAHIFHREKYHAIVRPALLTAMLGYTFVVIGLLADLGRYYNVWHPMFPSMWQGNSVLFEVGMCVMIYLTVLYIEFVPIVAERFKGRVSLPGPLAPFNRPAEWLINLSERTLGRFISVFIILGVVLSCLHQSSLGTLMVIAPTKVHPLWYTPISPLLFLMSAIAVGFPMVIFESLLAARSFKLEPERHVLSSLAAYIPVLLGAYLAVKVVDLTLREAWPYVLEGSLQSTMWLIEMMVGIVVPIVILSVKRLRRSMTALFVAASLVVVFGVALNRINMFLIAYKPLYPVKSYFPSIFEISVTIGLTAALVLVYRAVVMIFPVIAAPHKERPAGYFANVDALAQVKRG